MSTETRLETLRHAEPAWDDLREQRVLGRVVEAQRRHARRVRVARAGGLAAAAVAILFAAATWRPGASASRIVATSPAAPAPGGSSLSLADGSEATLSPGASVEVREQSDDRVVLDQSAGEVLYDVHPNHARDFVVQLGKVQVVVVGTRFRLAWAGEWVRVHVERGRVRVNDGARRVELVAGEELRVQAASAGEPVPAAPPPPPPDEEVAPPRGPELRSAPTVPPVPSLLAEADEARAAGRLSDAAAALGRIATFHAGDPRATSALFTLGRVERSRGRHGPAAAAFERCWLRSPRGSLAEDALAEAATSWAASGDRARAAADARRYLETFPHGPYAERMRRLSQ